MTYTFSVITKNTLSAGFKYPCTNVQYATTFYTFHYLHVSITHIQTHQLCFVIFKIAIYITFCQRGS